MCVLCAYVFVYTCIPDFFTNAINCTETLSGPSAFPSIYLISPLSFSLSKNCLH